jgi:hypothetical protein
MENSKSRTKAISLLLVVSSVLVFLALWDFPRENHPSNLIREL